jgi:ribosomal protein L39E
MKGKNNQQKKMILAKKGNQTKWAPVWAVLKKFGPGKRIHPSAMTRYRRSWRRTKLHITPRRSRKWHLG